MKERASIAIEAVTIRIPTVRAGKRFAGRSSRRSLRERRRASASSFLGHTAIVASLAWFMPAMANDDAEGISREQILMMQAMLDTSAEREQEQLKENAAGRRSHGRRQQGGEDTHEARAGQAGAAEARPRRRDTWRSAVPTTRCGSRGGEIEFAANDGLIGILRSGAPETGAQTVGRRRSSGRTPTNKLGAMFGADANDAMGYGLGLWGTGEGGGGKGTGIGIDGVGNTVGGGGGGPGKWGYGHGDKDGWGNGHGPGNGGHKVKDIAMRTPNVETNGGSPPRSSSASSVRIMAASVSATKGAYDRSLSHPATS